MKRPRNAGAARALMLKAILREVTGFLLWLCAVIIVAALLVGVVR